MTYAESYLLLVDGRIGHAEPLSRTSVLGRAISLLETSPDHGPNRIDIVEATRFERRASWVRANGFLCLRDATQAWLA